MTSEKLGLGLVTLVQLFLGYDVLAKLLELEPIYTATTSLGFSPAGVRGLAAFEALVLLIVIVPRTRRLGIILVTAFLGAALAVQLTAGHSMSYRVFPLVVATLLWTGQYLADQKWIRTLFEHKG